METRSHKWKAEPKKHRQWGQRALRTSMNRSGLGSARILSLDKLRLRKNYGKWVLQSFWGPLFLSQKSGKNTEKGAQKPVELSESGRFSRVLHEVQAQVEGRTFP